MLAADLCVGFVVLSLVGGASTALSRAAWTGRDHLAPAFALLGLGLVANLVWVLYWIAPLVGKVGSAALLVASIGVLARARFWRSWRLWAPLLMLTGGVGAAVVGFAFVRGGADNPFATASTRFVSLPIDNVIPHMFADRLWKGQSTALLSGDWNGSDRPPLQSGLILLVRPLGYLLGVDSSADQFDLASTQLAASVSILAQLLWVPAVVVLLKVLRFRSVVAATTVVFCACIPVVFLNTTFTWPKLMAAALAVAAVAVLADALVSGVPPPWLDMAVALVLFMLAFLSHGGVVFIGALVLIMVVLWLRRVPRRTGFRALGVGAGLAVVTYVPWVLYGRFADPSNNRLMKWHLAGVIYPNDDGLVYTIVHAYRTTPRSELLDNREANLKHVLRLDLKERWDFSPGWADRVRAYDFFGTAVALQAAVVLIVGLLLWVVVAWLLRRPVSARLRVGWTLCAGSVVSIFAWALVMFQPEGAIVHQGSYAWLLILLAVPFAFVADRLPAVGWMLVGWAALYACLAYSAPGPELLGQVSHVAVLTMVAGAVLTALATWAMAVGWDTPPRQRNGGRHRRPGDPVSMAEPSTDVSQAPSRP